MNKHTNMYGFTVMEILIVIAIISIMASGIFLNTPKLRLNASLETAVDEVLNTARNARNFASSGKELTSGVFPSYGITFDTSKPTQLIIYADCIPDDNTDGIVDNNDVFAYDPSACGGVSLVDTVTITTDKRIQIRAIRSIEASIISGSKAHVLYMRPDPTTWIIDNNGTALEYGRIEVDLGDTSGERLETILFWTSGHIEVK